MPSAISFNQTFFLPPLKGRFSRLTNVPPPILRQPASRVNSNGVRPKTQATAMLAPFALPKSLDTSPAHGFIFGKAVKPAFNTKLTKGLSALPQGKPSNNVSNMQAMLQPERPLQSAGSSHADPEPQASKGSCTESQQIDSSAQQVHKITGSSSNESRERSLHQPRGTSLQPVNSKEYAVTAKILAEGMLGSGNPIAEAAGPVSSTTTNGTQDEDTATIKVPTLVNEGSEYHTTSQGSSRSSSPSPSLGRSLQSYGQTVSNRSYRSMGQDTFGSAPSNRSIGQDTLDWSILQRQQPASKIRKRRAGSRRESLALPESPRQSTSSAVDPEDMLKALTIYYRKQMQQRAESKAKEKEKDDTITDFKTIIKLLDTQL
ncbi:MAG: hypothetical protein Q9180_002043 [Flavoplaca navasiana]